MAKLDPLTIDVHCNLDDTTTEYLIRQKSIDEAFEAAREILRFASVLDVEVGRIDELGLTLTIGFAHQGRISYKPVGFKIGQPRELIVRNARQALYGCTEEAPGTHWAFEHSAAKAAYYKSMIEAVNAMNRGG